MRRFEGARDRRVVRSWNGRSLHSRTAPPTTKSVLRRRGGDAFGKKVHFIGWDRVWLENGTALCQSQLFQKEQPKTEAPVASASAAPHKGGAPSLDPSISNGIVRVSATEFNIDRGVVDKILENQADLMRQARLVPEQENGKTVGIKMYGIRPDTLLRHARYGERRSLANDQRLRHGEPRKKHSRRTR